MRPQRGSRATSTTGASTCCAPRARTSRATTAKARSTRSGFQVLARAMACGKLVASGPCSPCSASSWKITGMPSRVCSFTHRWIALVNSASARAPWPSLGRSIRPIPTRNHSGARVGSKRPWASVICCLGVPEAQHLRHLLLQRHARGGPPRVAPWGARGLVHEPADTFRFRSRKTGLFSVGMPPTKRKASAGLCIRWTFGTYISRLIQV